MIFLTLNIVCMVLMNVCFYAFENYGAGFTFLGLQLFCFVMQLVTRGEV